MTKLLRRFLVLCVMSVAGACSEYNIAGMTVTQAFRDAHVAALARAAASGEIKTIELELKRGTNVNSVGEQGLTPLLWALGARNKAGVERLLKAGADPNYRMPDGESMMWFAAAGEDTQFLKIALEYGGDPNILGPDGRPAIIGAAFQYRWEHVRILFEHGADINKRGTEGDDFATVTASLAQFEQTAWALEHGFKGNWIDLAKTVEIRQIPPGSMEARWKERVIEMLKERGVSFPVYGDK